MNIRRAGRKVVKNLHKGYGIYRIGFVNIYGEEDETELDAMNINDLDYDVAKALAAEVISEEPFEAVTEEHLEKAEKMMDDCAEVICCVDKFGTMNAANRRLVEKAKRDGKLKTE